MDSFLKPIDRKKQAAPPISPARLQGKQKKTKMGKGKETTTPSPATDQKNDDTVATKTVDRVSDEPGEDPAPQSTDINGSNKNPWTTVTSKGTMSNEEKKKRAKATIKSLFDSDSDTDDEDFSLQATIPDKSTIYLLADRSASTRFSVTFEIETALDPEKVLKSTVSHLNTIMKQLTIEGQLSGYPGRAVIIPWEDVEVFSNRAWGKIKKSLDHTKLFPFVRQLLYSYGAPKGRKQDKDISRKYCRIHVAWVSPKSLSTDKIESLREYLSSRRTFEPDTFSLSPAPTMAINPTIAVQFRHSVLANPSNWNDKGHEDCIEELNAMLIPFLPRNVKVAGLKRVIFTTGQNFMKGDPSMLSLECEKSDEQIVTREMLQIFRSINRKTQIRDKRTVPWVAVPYFKGSDIQSNPKYQVQYANIKAKESTYQAGIRMKYMDGIQALDTVATEHSYLTPKVLKQLEEDIWAHNETPVRALIYDKLWAETKQDLATASLSKKKKSTEKDEKLALEKITHLQVLDEMAKRGYETWAPYDNESLPTPSPSKRTLREYLMSMKSRRFEDATSAPYVFESINNTDDGRVLFTFSENTMDEATTILDCLPLVIQHEMHIDPPCFLTDDFIKGCLGNYYNPLTRTGITAVAACLEDEVHPTTNPKHRIPEALRAASAKEIEQIFKRTENKLFSFSDDADLASLAESMASHKLPEKGLPRGMPKITDLQQLLETHHLATTKNEEVSVLSESSGLSFDSKTSKNRFEIERRADQMAIKKVDESIYNFKIKQGLTLAQSGILTQTLAVSMELPYDDIMRIIADERIPTSSIPDVCPNSGIPNTSDPHVGDSKLMATMPLQTVYIDIDNKEKNDQIFTGDSKLDHNIEHDLDDDMDNPFVEGDHVDEEMLQGADDPLAVELPDSDMSDDGDNSAVTQLHGSPNKPLASGSHDVGKPK